MSYEGFYRDGKTSRDYPGRLTFEENILAISYREEGGEALVFWPKEEVSLAEGSRPERIILLCQEGQRGSFVFSVDKKDFQAISAFFGKRKGRWWLFLFSLVGIGMFLFWFWGLPFLIDKSVDVFLKEKPFVFQNSEKVFEVELPFSVKVNEKATKKLRTFVSRYLSGDFPLVMVVNVPVENAFATLSGNILVSERILLALRSPDELAALLYHEEGHLKYHHPLKMFLRRNIGIFLLMLVTGANDVSQLVVKTGEEMMVLQYSRDFEILADEYALERLMETGFDPEAMEKLLLFLSERNQEGFWLFSTHPSFEKRITLLREKRKQMKMKRGEVSLKGIEKDFLSLKQEL